jgi:hypothetical protein
MGGKLKEVMGNTMAGISPMREKEIEGGGG